MRPDGPAANSPLRPMELERLRKALDRQHQEAGAMSVTLDSLDPVLDSASMRPGDWLTIAGRIACHYAQYDGFVIIHGTDTLAYTASALSFLFENLAKPVVLTGAQRPMMQNGSDAPENYRTALRLAAHSAFQLPCVPEVIVAFGGKIMRGCRTRKLSASAFDGFHSPNFPLLGEVAGKIRLYPDRLLPAPTHDAPFRAENRINPNVLDIAITPALRPEQLSHMLVMDSVEGIVLRTYGAGTAPDHEAFAEALSTGLAGGKPAIAVSQCDHAMVDFDLYAVSKSLRAAGVIPGRDLTPEAALAKLMVLLPHHSGDALRERLSTSLRGEQF